MFLHDFQVVADVDKYTEFVPWCVGSAVFERNESHAKANLKIGMCTASWRIIDEYLYVEICKSRTRSLVGLLEK